MSLRTRLALAFALVAAAVAVAMGSLAYIATANRLDAELDRALAASTESLVRAMSHGDRPGPGLDGDAGRPPGPGGREGLGEDYPAQYLTADGTVVVLTTGAARLPVDDVDRALAAAARAASSTRDVLVGGTAYRMTTQGLGDGQGAVQVARDRAESDRVLAALAIILAAIGVLVAGGAALAGWFLARQITRRLVQLTDVAAAVGGTGRLDLTVPTAGSDEVGRLGRAFDTMLGRLAAAREDQQRLVQDAAHELRTPLTSVRTNAALLRSFDRLAPDERDRVVADLQGETRELAHLVDEIVDLAVAAAPGGSATPDAEPVDLLDVAERMAARARRRSGRGVVVQGSSCLVRGDRPALDRAVWNLLDNALKFDAGAGPVEVAVGDGVVLVSDRGPGIAAIDLPHVFDRFYRATDSRSRPGSGLGLAIVRDVAVTHGGEAFARPRGDGPGVSVGFAVGTVLPGAARESSGAPIAAPDAR